jgi:hypothetical protein
VTAVNHAEKGTSGMNLDIAAHMLALSEQKGPAIQVFGDNQGVVDNVSHISHKSKGLKRCSCGLAFAQLRHDIVKFYKVAGRINWRMGCLAVKFQCATPSCWPGSTGGIH